MNGLKQSLEEAIKEMQEIPADAPSSSRHDEGDLRLARAADTLQILHGVAGGAEPAPESESLRELLQEPPPIPTDTTKSEPEFIPAANSIEAALTSAPAVSPHYIPPKPTPAVAVASTKPVAQDPPVTAPSLKEPSQPAAPTLEPAPRASLPRRAKPIAAMPPKPVRRINQSLSPHQANEPMRPIKPGGNAPDISDADEFLAATPKGNDETHKKRDNIWRWTTIGLSCVGGLASGWLGSNISGEDGGIFKSEVQTIVGKASEPATLKPPASIRITRGRGAARTAGAVDEGATKGLTGKTDRAVPLDDDLCTVLELNRGTGLTLAKPCKEIKTAEFFSTLGKSDLLAKPE